MRLRDHLIKSRPDPTKSSARNEKITRRKEAILFQFHQCNQIPNPAISQKHGTRNVRRGGVAKGFHPLRPRACMTAASMHRVHNYVNSVSKQANSQLSSTHNQTPKRAQKDGAKIPNPHPGMYEYLPYIRACSDFTFAPLFIYPCAYVRNWRALSQKRVNANADENNKKYATARSFLLCRDGKSFVFPFFFLFHFVILLTENLPGASLALC